MDKKDNKYQEQLRGMLKEILGEANLEEAKEIAAETNEKVIKLVEANTELKERLEAIEAMPAKEVNLQVPGTDKTAKFMYKGYDLRQQGATLDLPAERKEMVAKFLIDCIKATNVEGTGSRGGFLVPDEYWNEVLAFARQTSFALQDAQVINMGTDVMRIPAEASNIAVTWTAEEADIGQSNPTFAEVVLTAKRVGSYSIASNELLEDEQYDFVSMLTSQFAEAMALEIDDRVMNAGGSSTFTGALSGASTNTVTCAATGTSPSRHIQITHAELSEAISKLTDNKLRGAKFYIHQNSMHYIRVEQDTAGNPIFARPGNGVPGTIYEYPYVVSDKVGSATPGAAAPFILFGNLKNYVLGIRRQEARLEIDPFGLFDTYRTRFRLVWRANGKPGLEKGLVAIKTHA